MRSYATTDLIAFATLAQEGGRLWLWDREALEDKYVVKTAEEGGKNVVIDTRIRHKKLRRCKE